MLADGAVIYNSHVICEYLDTLHDGRELFPPAGAERLQALRHEALADGIQDVGLQSLAERVRPPERQSAPHMALWRAKREAAVEALEHEADALAAGPFDIGHLCIGVALGYLDFRFADESWRDGHPRLAAWHEGFNRRPSVLANLPVDDS